MNIAPIILTVITALSPLATPTASSEPVGQQTSTNTFQQQGLPYPKYGSKCGIISPGANLAATGTSTPLMATQGV